MYTEKLSSSRTTLLFLALTVVFGGLLAWRVWARGLDGLAAALLAFGLFFLFYTLNYRTLVIELDAAGLKLKFGVFTWRAPWENIAAGRLDELPTFKRLGGAGIHFMFVGGRYRASLNFLEYPRVAVALKRKMGPVEEISFSTRRPEEVLRVLAAHGGREP
jgi:hypothetical protein